MPIKTVANVSCKIRPDADTTKIGNFVYHGFGR
jgi:hypothetical protein